MGKNLGGEFMREYTTQMDAAKKGIITREMEIVANKESKNPEEIRSLVAERKGGNSSKYKS